MAADPDIALLERALEARERGDLSVIEAALAPDAKWRAVQDGPWNCEDRDTIVKVMRRNLAGRAAGRIEELTRRGNRILVAFRPAHPEASARQLDDGIAYVVVSMRDGLIAEIKACADRTSALAYQGAGG